MWQFLSDSTSESSDEEEQAGGEHAGLAAAEEGPAIGTYMFGMHVRIGSRVKVLSADRKTVAIESVAIVAGQVYDAVANRKVSVTRIERVWIVLLLLGLGAKCKK